MGNNIIKAAEYFVGATAGAAGTGSAMMGTFTSPTVAVTATVNTSAWTAVNSPYTLHVRGQDSENNWGAAQSVQVIVYQLPAAPVLTNVVSPTNNKRPVLAWGAVAGAVSYDLQVSADQNFAPTLMVETGLAATSYTTSSDALDGTYYWRVRAVDSAGRPGPWAVSTALVIDTTGPAAVSNLVVTQLPVGDLKLDWSNPTPDFAGVIVLAKTGSAPLLVPVNGTTYNVGTNDVVASGSINTYTDADLAHGIRRFYKVFAYDALRNYSSVAAIDSTSSDTTPPAPVTGFTATPGDTKATLNWTNPTTADFAGVIILYRQTSAPTVDPVAGTSYTVGAAINDATVGYKGTGTTAEITGLTNNVSYHFAIYAFDERPNYSTVLRANATPVPFGITAPVAATVDIKVGQQISLTATGPSGSFQWTATGGTLSAATGANVTWTAPATVPASPTTYTVTLRDGVNQALTATRTIRVFSGVSVTNKPATTPTIQPDASSTAFTVSGGDSTQYTWTVAGPVAVAGGTGASYTFKAPKTGNFAGEYTITVTDNLGLSTDSFKIGVPFTVDPKSGVFTETKLDGTANPQTLTFGGAASFNVEILATPTATTPVANPAAYGTWNPADNTFTPADVTAITEFYLRITVAGLPAGLNQQVVGPFKIIPVAAYKVTVTDAAGAKLPGATVCVEYPKATIVCVAATNAQGEATFNLPDSGGNYAYQVSLANYVTQIKISNLKAVPVVLVGSNLTITGAVETTGGGALTGATVTAYLPAAPTVQYEAQTVGAGSTYTINLPTGAATTGWTVVASMPNFVSVSKTGVALAGGTVAVNFTGAADGLAMKALGAPDVDAGGGTKIFTASGQTAEVDIPAGGLAVNAFIGIAQAAKTSTTSLYTSASPGFVYQVKLTTDAAGVTPVAAGDIKRIIITLPIDLGVLKPGDLEKGNYKIYKATTLANLEAGTGLFEIPAANILQTDYVGDGAIGSVTFWTDRLSFFGVGLSVGGGGVTLTDTSSDGRCFIATAAYGSSFEKHVEILRAFRDAYLLPSKAGRLFVETYYSISPKAAAFIAERETLKVLVRGALLPFVGVSYLLLQFGVLGFFMLLGVILIGTMAIIYRRRRISLT